MREIKFRAWDLVDRHWCGYALRGFVLIDDGAKEQEVIQWSPKRDGKILMQYTGLKDKNGREIYEEDIVRWNGEARVVRYCNSYSCGKYELDLHQKGMGGVLSGDPENWYDLEVIGNIYENPELLSDPIK